MITIGIIGSGQLAQMITHVAYTLSIKTLCYSQNKNCPASIFSPIFVGDFFDLHAIKSFVKKVDIVTIENENIPKFFLLNISKYIKIFPNKKSIFISQNRLLEKQLFKKLNILTTKFIKIYNFLDLQKSIDTFPLPAMLKTQYFGYDGKGQYFISHKNQIFNAWKSLQKKPCILENIIPFSEETSIIAARNSLGNIQFYPLIKNKHISGILYISTLDSNTEHPLQKKAEKIIKNLMEYLDYIGIMVLEFFVFKNELIANEIAPRVHNSGHITLNACNINQFEQHLRSILDMPLLKPLVLYDSAMINILGKNINIKAKNIFPEIHVYKYRKEEFSRRKLGHINITASSTEKREKIINQILKKFPPIL